MIRALRRTRLAPLFAAIALFAMTPVTVLSLLHDESDDACNPAIVIHDANAHRVGAAPSTTLPDSQHCVLCHTLQSLRAIATAVRLGAPPADARLLAPHSVDRLTALIVSSRPARAPPIFS